jgi:low affinity Fe/Cu permease
MAARFSRWSSTIATASGYWQTFVLMTALCVVWALSGPFFGFSDTWQLVINTATTVLTFLMVFLIQNTQNRDALAVHLKLDEIIRAIDEADDKIMSAEHDDEREMAELKKRYLELSNKMGVEPPDEAKSNGASRQSVPVTKPNASR